MGLGIWWVLLVYVGGCFWFSSAEFWVCCGAVLSCGLLLDCCLMVWFLVVPLFYIGVALVWCYV